MARNPGSAQIQKETVRVIQGLKRVHLFTEQAVIGKWLIEILENFDSLVAHQGKGGEDIEVSLTAVRGELRKVVVRKDLVSALSAILGNEKRKLCAGPCGQEKMLSAFSIDKIRDDGRNRICLLCERKRVKEYSDKRRRDGLK